MWQFAFIMMVFMIGHPEHYVSGNRCMVPVYCNEELTWKDMETDVKDCKGGEIQCGDVTKLASKLTELSDKVEELWQVTEVLRAAAASTTTTTTSTTTADALTTTPKTTTPARIGCNGVVYDENCYFAEVHRTYDISLPRARAICSKGNGTLSDIYSEDHYNMVVEYIRSIMPNIEYVGLWLAMEPGLMKQNGEKVVKLSDGTVAPFVTWFPGRPSYDPNYVAMSFRVTRDVDASYKGMYDFNPVWEEYGVLCREY